MEKIEYAIKRATASDAGEMLKYLKTIGRESDFLSFGAEGVGLSEAEEANWLARQENSTDFVQLVAKIGDKVIGAASLMRRPRKMRHRGEFGISVLKEFWHKGVATALTEEILRLAKEYGFEQVFLEVRSDNERAKKLYEKFGFKKICVYPDFMRVNGVSYSCDMMILQLSE